MEIEGIRTDEYANIGELHPELKRRLKLLDTVESVKDKWLVVSGARTKAEQTSLYKKWLRGDGNKAASPTSYIGTWNGIVFRGSYHMVQSTGYAYAVDLRWSVPDSTFKSACNYVGLKQTVLTPIFEEWHYQPFTVGTGWFPVPHDQYVKQAPAIPQETDKDDEMPYLMAQKMGDRRILALFNGGGVRHIGPVEFGIYNFFKVHVVTIEEQDEWDRLLAACPVVGNP